MKFKNLTILLFLFLFGCVDNPYNYPAKYSRKDVSAKITSYGFDRNGLFIEYKTETNFKSNRHIKKVCKNLPIVGSEITLIEYTSKLDNSHVFYDESQVTSLFCNN